MDDVGSLEHALTARASMRVEDEQVQCMENLEKKGSAPPLPRRRA